MRRRTCVPSIHGPATLYITPSSVSSPNIPRESLSDAGGAIFAQLETKSASRLLVPVGSWLRCGWHGDSLRYKPAQLYMHRSRLSKVLSANAVAVASRVRNMIRRRRLLRRVVYAQPSAVAARARRVATAALAPSDCRRPQQSPGSFLRRKELLFQLKVVRFAALQARLL